MLAAAGASMRVALVLCLLAGCPVPSDRDGEVRHDTDARSGDPVHWTWKAPAPVPVRDTPVSTEHCNAGGRDDGVCPDGFACVPAHPVAGADGALTTIADCVADGGSITLVGDLRSGAGRHMRDVALVFERAGGAWPADGDPSEVPFLTLTPREGGAPTFAPLPTGGADRLALTLLDGTYDASFTPRAEDFDWPIIGRDGVLVVEGDGEAQVDVDVVPLDITMLIDSLPLTSALDVSLTFEGATTPRFRGSLTEGDAFRHELWLPPDTYTVAVAITAIDGGDTEFPGGTVDLLEPLVVVRDGRATLPIDLHTVEVDGQVRVDGVAPAADAQMTVLWSNRNTSYAFTAPGGHYAGRLFEGRYDVLVSSNDPDVVVKGTAQVATDVAAAPRDLDIATVHASGVLTVSGAQPPERRSGTLVLRHADGTTNELSLPSDGPATFDGRVFDGPADLWLHGDDKTLAAFVRIATDITPADGMTIDVPAWELEFPLLVGGVPADVFGGVPETLQLVPLDPVSGDLIIDPTRSIGSTWTELSALSWRDNRLRGLVAGGTYRVDLIGIGWRVPYGRATLVDRLVVDGPITQTFDIHPVDVALELRVDGAPPPAVATGDRGAFVLTVQLPTSYVEIPLHVPASGPALATGTLLPGALVESVRFECREDWGCTSGLPYTMLWTWLRP